MLYVVLGAIRCKNIPVKFYLSFQIYTPAKNLVFSAGPHLEIFCKESLQIFKYIAMPLDVRLSGKSVRLSGIAKFSASR